MKGTLLEGKESTSDRNDALAELVGANAPNATCFPGQMVRTKVGVVLGRSRMIFEEWVDEMDSRETARFRVRGEDVGEYMSF